MMRRFVVFAALVVLFGSHGVSQAPRGPRLLLISVDGLMPSSYTDPASRAPALRALAARGAWASGVTGVWPTNTRPSHTSLITGVRPAIHGIVDNDILDPERRANTVFNWFARDIKAPTPVGAARAAGLSTAVVMWPVSVGLDSTYLVPTFNWQQPRDEPLLRALSTPRLLDDFERAIRAPFRWPPVDAQRVELTRFLVRDRNPDVILLYFGTLDAFQHTYGPEAPMTASSLKDVDALLDDLLTSLGSEKRLEGTFVAVVS